MKKKLLLILGVAFGVFFLLLSFKGRREKMTGEREDSSLVRPPAVAGSFYPQNPKQLGEILDQLFSQAKKIPSSEKLKILILPHAGINYSGLTAAWGFKQIQNESYSKIILLGVSHQHWFDHAAVWSKGQWETPLGKVAIDQSLAKKIISPQENILADESVHYQEHSLELELIFLQRVLSNFKIVPILISHPNKDLINHLGEKIAQNLDQETLLVVSTDLSHYPPYSLAQRVDEETIKAIITGDPEKFAEKIKEIESQGYSGLETAACGQEAVKVALVAGKILAIDHYQKIYYQNSGDTGGNPEAVVGYAAIGGWKKEKKQTSFFLDPLAQKEALRIARQTLEEYLTTGHLPAIKTQHPALEKKLGVFVTLKKAGQLRGCIGRFEPEQSLAKTIQQMAVAAATQDIRFPPVVPEELKEIKIEISVLTPKKKVNDWREIKLGRDGVVVEKGNRSGTFLPQVAEETGWSLEEFLAQLCSQKAGLPPDCYRKKDVNLYTFQAQVFEEE